VAERMIAMSGKDVAIVFTGLRHGEKLHEELMGDAETDERPIHPKISHTAVNSIPPDRLNKDEWIARCHADFDAFAEMPLTTSRNRTQ
jgi:FlaA1/EpsC-like NDP-sugar epimerase